MSEHMSEYSGKKNNNLPTARNEKEAEVKLHDESLRDIYHKASKLEYDDFKGWFKGQGYLLSRKEL